MGFEYLTPNGKIGEGFWKVEGSMRDEKGKSNVKRQTWFSRLAFCIGERSEENGRGRETLGRHTSSAP